MTMKKIIISLVAFCFVLIAKAQYPINQSIGADSTLVTSKGGLKGRIINWSFTDTTQANTQRVRQYLGSQIYTTSDNFFWLRNSTATKWERVAKMSDITNVSGCYALLKGGLISWSGSGLTMDVTAAEYVINCKEYSTIKSQVTLAAADATFDRFDIIYVDTNSTVGVITGTASGTPIFPQIDPSSQLQLAVISVPAGSTTPGDVSSLVIYNENIEWTSGSSMSSGTVDFVSTNTPFIGTKNALISSSAKGTIYWDTTSPININDYTLIKMYVKIDGYFITDVPSYIIYLRSGGNVKTNPIYLTDYGLNTSIIGSYQIVTIPITAFTFLGGLSQTFDGVQLKFNNGSAALHIDYVQLQGGLPNENSPYITNIFRVPGVDSIFFTKNGINYGVKDSTGGGSGGSYTFTSPLSETAGVVKWNGDLTEDVVIGDLSGTYSLGFNKLLYYDVYSAQENYQKSDTSLTFFAGPNKVGNYSSVLIRRDSISLHQKNGNIGIPVLPAVTSLTGIKLLGRDTTGGGNGKVYDIDPALIGGGSYTFPYSVVAPGNAVQLENDTIPFANGVYTFNSAARRTWVPISSLVGVNLYNSDGTLSGDRILTAPDKELLFTGTNEFGTSKFRFNNSLGFTRLISTLESLPRDSAMIQIATEDAGVIMFTSSRVENSSARIFVNPSGAYMEAGDSTIGRKSIAVNKDYINIVGIPYTLSTVGKKLMIRDTTTGLVENIDPALIGGGGSGITVGTTTITSGTNGRIGYNNSGVYGEKAVTGTGDVVLATSPTLVTPDLGTPSALVGTNISGTISTRWKARVGSTTSSATPTINTDNVDIYKLTAQSAAISSFTTNLSGSPQDGDILEIQITDDGTARAITWGASFVSTSVTLPTTTTISTTLTIILQYYTTSSYGSNKWACVNYY